MRDMTDYFMIIRTTKHWHKWKLSQNYAIWLFTNLLLFLVLNSAWWHSNQIHEHLIRRRWVICQINTICIPGLMKNSNLLGKSCMDGLAKNNNQLLQWLHRWPQNDLQTDQLTLIKAKNSNICFQFTALPLPIVQLLLWIQDYKAETRQWGFESHSANFRQSKQIIECISP